jgi:hypothetical protein
VPGEREQQAAGEGDAEDEGDFHRYFVVPAEAGTQRLSRNDTGFPLSRE